MSIPIVDILPPGIRVLRDHFYADGIRVAVMRDTDRRYITFTVPWYKTTMHVRTGLFSWKEIEVFDDEKIGSELLERGLGAVRELLV